MPVSNPARTLFGPSAVVERTVAALNAAGPPARLDHHAELAAPFRAVLRDAGEPGSLAGIEAETAALAAVLDELYAIFAAPDEAAAVARLNAALARHTAPLRLVAEPGAAWHLHADRPGDETWAGWFAASSLVGLAVHTTEHGAPAFGVCAAHGCIHVFAQTGPGRPRTTCSPRCGSRVRQAELRARRRSADR